MNQAPMPQMPEITATELKQRLDSGEDIQIVDVREANEVAVAKLPNSIHIPLAQVVNRMSEIDPARETVVHCKMGGRSAKAIEALKRSGFAGRVFFPSPCRFWRDPIRSGKLRFIALGASGKRKSRVWARCCKRCWLSLIRRA